MIARTASLLLALALVCPPSGHGATVRAVAKAGDGTPVGGIYAGPSFTGWPSAAGAGWVAFRSALEAGSSAEAIIAAHFTDPAMRVQVARVGQQVGNIGTLRGFRGRPTINAGGDVAFLASYRDDAGTDATGVFLFRHDAVGGEVVSRIAYTGQAVTVPGIASATIDLDTPGEAGAGPSDDDTPLRAAALNDGGLIAFVATVGGGAAPASAIFTAAPGGDPTALVWSGATFAGGGAFTGFGTPAVNALGDVAFRATLDDPGGPDGIFLASGGTITRRAATGLVPTPAGTPAPSAQPLLQFGNGVSLNDAGDVGFTGGPLIVDPANPPAPGADPEFGACVARGGPGDDVFLVGYPKEGDLSVGQITGVSLSLAADNLPVPPMVGADRSVVYFASAEGGAREVIARKSGDTFATRDVLAVFGRDTPNEPSGGVYRSCESGAAVDALGAVVFSARAAGGAASELLAYQPGTDSVDARYVAQGEAAPGSNSGYFGGPPFPAARVLDDGDVVFKAFVAHGQTSVGIFRAHFDAGPDGRLVATTTKLVGAGDPSPLGFGDSAERFVDIVGNPDSNGAGSVVFAARVENEGRGIYGIAPDGTLRLVVRLGDPGPTGGTFETVSRAPSINADGGIAFEGSVRIPDDGGGSHVQAGVFYVPPGGTPQLMASTGGDSTVGPFFKFRDPANVSRVPSLAFRASLGDVSELAQGMFVVDTTHVTPLAVTGQLLGDGATIKAFSGSPSTSDAGDAVFVADQVRNGADAGNAIFRFSSADGLARLVSAGDAGPAGGRWSSLSSPTMTPSGHLVFRGGFAPGSGGVGGLFRGTDSGVKPFVLANDVTPIGGKFSAFGTTLGLNGQDDMAFTATVSGAAVRNGVFVASPTVLLAQTFALKLSGGKKRDRATLGLTLALGRIAVDSDLDPSHKVIYVTLSHGGGLLASIKIGSGQLKKQGNKYVTRSKELRSFRLAIGRKRTYRVKLQTGPLDLTDGGRIQLQAPISVGLQVGDDGGVAIGRCAIRTRSVRCTT